MPRIEGTQVVPDLYMPILIVSVTVNGQQAPRLPCIVDSGADLTMLPSLFTERCGLEWKDIPGEAEEGQGAGCKFLHKPCEGAIEWRGEQVSNLFRVIEPPKDPNNRLIFGLLGRNDFFTKYNVQFNWHRQPPVMFVNELAQATKPARRRK